MDEHKDETTEEIVKRDDPQKELSLWETFKILFGASKGFWLVNMVNFGDGIAYFGILTLLTLFLGDQGVRMGDKLSGFSVSWFTGFVTLFMFGGGFVSDRLGVRRALTLSLVLLAGGRVLLTLTPSLHLPLLGSVAVSWLALLFMAFGTGVLQPALYAGIKEYTDPRTATIGYGLLYAIMNLGIWAESLVSPYIRSDEMFLGFQGLGLGIAGVFWLCIGITLLMLVVHLLFFTRHVEETCRVAVDPKKEVAHEGPRTLKERMMELPFLDARFMFFIFILLPVRTLFAHQWLTLPDYIFRAYPSGVSAKYEWISGLNPLIIVIFVPTIAAMTRRVNIVTMMVLGTALSAVTTFILVPGSSLTALIVYVLLFSLGEALWSSRFLEYVADIAPQGKVGAYMGLAGIPWFLAKFTTGLYSGTMLERFVPPIHVSVSPFVGLPVPGKVFESLLQKVDICKLTDNQGLITAVGQSMGQDTSTLWLIYALVALISPIGLALAYRWLTSRGKTDAVKA